MSVWKVPFFKYDGPQALARMMDESKFPMHVLNFLVDDREKLLGTGVKATLAYMIESGAVDWQRVGFEFATHTNPEVDALLESKTRYYTGMSAFAHMVELVHTGAMKWKNPIPWEKWEELYVAMTHVVGPSTQVNPGAFTKALREVDMGIKAKYWREAAESIKLAKIAAQKNQKSANRITLDKILHSDKIVFYAYKDVIFGSFVEEAAQQILVITLNEMDRLITFFNCVSAIIEYASSMSKPCIIVFLLELLGAIVTNKNGAINYLCRAFHKLKDLELAKLADDLKLFDFDEIWGDIKTDNLDKLINYDKMSEFLNTLSTLDKIDCLYVYKCFPPPDFCPVTALTVMKRFHDTPNTVSIDTTDFLRHMRGNFIRAHYVAYKLWPGTIKDATVPWVEAYTTNAPMAFPDAYADNIDLTGAANFIRRGSDAFMKLEDKTVAAMDTHAYSSAAAFKTTRKSQKSALLATLQANSLPDSTEMDPNTTPNVVQAEYKPEAHKPDSRIFFMSNLHSRTLKGEVEDSIRALLPIKPGCSMGAEPKKLERYLSDLTAWEEVTLNTPYKNVFFSFDMAKWSPRYPKAIKELCWKFWGELLGDARLIERLKLTYGTRVVSMRCGIKLEYVTHAVDFEGDQGAMNTWLHSDLMSYAVKTARDNFDMDKKVHLATFIDDGLMRATISTSNIRPFWAQIQRTYENLGFKTSLGKTNVSSMFATYLGRNWVDGVETTSGVKAYLKIQPDYAARFRTFPEEVGHIFSSVQGAIKAGSRWVSAYAKYLKDFAMSIIRWTRWGKLIAKNDIPTIALIAFTPISLGGFGCSSFQGLVSTLETSPLSMGMGIIRAAAVVYPSMKKYVSAVINQDLAVPSPVQILRNPKRLKRAATTLDKTIVEREIKSMLESGKIASGTWFQNIIKEASAFPLETYAETLITNGRTNPVMLKLAYKITPVATFDTYCAKFRRAGTLVDMMPATTIKSLRLRSLKNFQDTLATSIRLN